MEYGWEFFWSVIASSAGTTVLLGVLGWLCRGQISHWLSKDLEAAKAQHQRDLQREKVEFERQLEAYRVSLIAEAERAKAAQSIRTAGALRMMEHKFNALTDLFKAIRDYASTSISFCAMTFPNLEIFVTHQTRITDRLLHAATAIEAVAPFIPLADYQQFLRLHNALVGGIRERTQADLPMAPERLEEFRVQVIPLQVAVNGLLQQHITAMFDVA